MFEGYIYIYIYSIYAPVCHSTTGWILLKFSVIYEDPLASQDANSVSIFTWFFFACNGAI